MIGLKLGTYLNTRPTILNRLSNRIYPDRVPQQYKSNFPRAIISVIGGNPDYSLGGPIADVRKVVQVDVDSLRCDESKEIALLIKDEIEFSGTVPGDQAWGDVTVKSVVVEQERDTELPPMDSSDDWIFRRTIEYGVRYVR